jgi:hypothetical protein
MSISIVCPHCGVSQEFSDKAAGKILDCLDCEKRIIIPARKTKQPPESPESLEDIKKKAIHVWQKDLPAWAVVGGVIVLLVICSGITKDRPNGQPNRPSVGGQVDSNGPITVGVTRANFNRIVNGMTLREVEGVLGNGEEIDRRRNRDEMMCTWESGRTIILVFFTNGRVDGKEMRD